MLKPGLRKLSNITFNIYSYKVTFGSSARWGNYMRAQKCLGSEITFHLLKCILINSIVMPATASFPSRESYKVLECSSTSRWLNPKMLFLPKRWGLNFGFYLHQTIKNICSLLILQPCLSSGKKKIDKEKEILYSDKLTLIPEKIEENERKKKNSLLTHYFFRKWNIQLNKATKMENLVFPKS